MKQKILVTVKTYPCLSSKHIEVVCTAGINKNGNWVRVYPIPYRLMDKENKFSKYQWIEADIIRNTDDPRPESFKLVGNIKPLEFITTQDNWRNRKKLILKNIYTNLEDLINQARNSEEYTSLATFKPKKIISFHIEKDISKIEIKKKRKFLEKHLSKIQARSLAEKVPYKFFYTFIDEDEKRSCLQILDWEIYQPCRKLIKKFGKKKTLIYKHLKQKYFDEFIQEREIYLFLGTNKYWHIRRSKNPFMIVGIFYPPKI